VIPETRYAKTVDGVHIAYQAVGGGAVDIVAAIGWTTNIEAMWEEPSLARWLTRLSTFGRLIIFDKRGVGLSDRVPESQLPTLETRMDDVRAVMDAAGSERAVVFGISEGGPMSIAFAATYPERTIALVLFGTGTTWEVGDSAEFTAYIEDMDRSGGPRSSRVRSSVTGPRRASPKTNGWWPGLPRTSAARRVRGQRSLSRG